MNFPNLKFEDTPSFHKNFSEFFQNFNIKFLRGSHNFFMILP